MQVPGAEEDITHREKKVVDTGSFAHCTLYTLVHRVHGKYGVCRLKPM